MRKVALVLAGGFCGTLARYLFAAPVLAMAALVLPGARSGFPYGIFAINLSGALAMGLLYGLVESSAPISPDARLALGTGFLGAYTTFSTFVYGGEQLLGAGQYAVGLTYLAGSLVLGVFCARAGHALAAAFTPRPHRAWRQLRLAHRRWQRADARARSAAPQGLPTHAADRWLRAGATPTPLDGIADPRTARHTSIFDYATPADTHIADDRLSALERQDARP